MDLEILREKNPRAAAFIDTWKLKYQRGYDFNKIEDQAIFYEGMLELGRHIPANAGSAYLKVDISSNGISGAQIQVTQETKGTSAS